MFVKYKTYFNVINIVTTVAILWRLYDLQNAAPGSALTILLNGLGFLTISTINLYLTAALLNKPLVKEHTKVIKEQYIEPQDDSQKMFYAEMLNELDQFIIVIENGSEVVFRNNSFKSLTKKIKTPILDLKMFKYQTFNKSPGDFTLEIDSRAVQLSEMLSISEIMDKSTKWLQNKLFWMNETRKTHNYTMFSHESFTQVKFKIVEIKNMKSG